MADYVLLNNVEHQDVRIITDRSARYGDDLMLSPTFAFEFRNVQAHYPILFQQDAAGMLYPVALFGFQEGENLFLDDSGWRAGYIPAMVRREPFLIGYQDSAGAEGGERMRMLSLDMAHPRVNKAKLASRCSNPSAAGRRSSKSPPTCLRRSTQGGSTPPASPPPSRNTASSNP